MTLLFFVCVAVLLYIYAGYPLLLSSIVWWRGPRPVKKVDFRDDCCPSVSLVISAYNEADVIRAKLENALALDYPDDRFEIVVVSDASSDGTDEIVREFGPRVRLVRQDERLGKTAGLNGVVPALAGELVVFSDANAMYQADAIRMLVRNFGDRTVGCATGESRYVGGEQTSSGAGEHAYWSYEMWIKRLETDVGSMVGGDGAIYAIRRLTWTPLPTTAINDFLNPLQIVAAGWRAVYESDAVCHEAPAASARKEYRRRVRIVSRSWRAVFQAATVLNPWRVGFFALSVFSHKVLRWLAGLFVVGAGVSVVSVASTWGPVLGALPTGVLALGAWLVVVFCAFSRIAGFAWYFVTLQLAALVGVVFGSIGKVPASWAPPRETGDAGGALDRDSGTGRWRISIVGITGVLAWSVWFALESHPATLALFWGSAAILGYVFIGYPIVLATLSWLVPKPVARASTTPSVCLFITANDEDVVIEEKIKNSLALDYPSDRLRIVVASDGSVDGTNRIVESFADAGVRLLAFSTRRGKMAAINAGVPLVEDSEILVFSDANTFLAPNALTMLVQPFHDEAVGAVSGNVRLVGDRAALAVGEDLYYRYERWLQSVESTIGSMVGADGALYAIRRSLFAAPPDDTILDDVSIPMDVIRQGRRVVLAPEALAYEPGTRTASDELLRKSRVVAGAVLLLARWSELPSRPIQVVFSLISHKVLRWLSPGFAVGTLVGSVLLAPTGLFYELMAVGHLGTATLGLLGCIPVLRRFPVVGVANYFVLVQLAAGIGLLRGLRGGQAVMWQRFSRTSVSPQDPAIVKSVRG